METRQVLLVDAFADEPMGGLPVAVVPEGADLASEQLESITGEFGTDGVITPGDDGLCYVAHDDSEAVVEGAVAGASALTERDQLQRGEQTVLAGGTEYSIEIEDDGVVWVDLPEPELDEPDIDHEAVASALNIDVAALRDVGADLPLARADAGGGSLLAPVNFLEHLSGATPQLSALGEVLEATDCRRLFVFTFDTLGSATDLHARIFDVAGRERATSGLATAGCGRHLSQQRMFDGEKDEIRVESGQFLDRPSTLRTTLDHSPRVAGTALTVLDGNLTIPGAETDDIIEL